MLNRLFVAAALLFAFAECQYGGVGGGYFGGASLFGSGYNGGGYSTGGFSGYPGNVFGGYPGSSYSSGGYGGSSFGSGFGLPNPYASGSTSNYNFGSYTPSGGQDLNVNQPTGGISSIAYNSNQFTTPYYPSLPYRGSPFGTYDYYQRNYADMYGNFYPKGSPQPPPYSGGVPYGFYEPDTYASGLPPLGFKANPNAGSVRPINGFPGALAPNPFYMADDEQYAQTVFDKLYKQNYGRKYNPDNVDLTPVTPPVVAPPKFTAPGTNYFGYNVGLNSNGLNPGFHSYPTPGGYGNLYFNYYGQPVAPPPPNPPATTPAPTTTAKPASL